MIQLVDLQKQYSTIKNEIDTKISEVIESTAFIQGKYAKEFEETFAKAHGAKYAIGCSNGTSALCLVLEAMGIKEGDEVITTPNTFIATIEAICYVKAKPVFVDIDEESYNIDISKIESKINSKTKAIIPVHIYGNPVNMEEIMKIANKHNLQVVENCAQAHLANVNGKCVGTFGAAGTFSFYPGKNLGAYGDAGGIITNSDELNSKIRKLLDHGRSSKYLHDEIGYNHRMDGLQAAILSVKMKYLGDWTQKRISHANKYNELISNKVSKPKTQKNCNHVYHVFALQHDKRDEIIKSLNSKNISSAIHYPVPCHLQPALAYLGYKKGDFPVSEKFANKCFSLPMYPELTDEEIKYIANEVNSACESV